MTHEHERHLIPRCTILLVMFTLLFPDPDTCLLASFTLVLLALFC